MECPVSYGDDRYEDRSELRAVVWEISGGRCEWPYVESRCHMPAVELAHIQPRGMGHTGYRDTVNNTMAACWEHARVTDDLSRTVWGWIRDTGVENGMTERQHLAHLVRTRRAGEGWAV